MESKFSVDFFSDTKYECMTAEISYDGQILCQINKDRGNDNMEIEFFHEQRILRRQTVMKFPLDDFLSLISQAKAELADIE